MAGFFVSKEFLSFFLAVVSAGKYFGKETVSLLGVDRISIFLFQQGIPPFFDFEEEREEVVSSGISSSSI